jgi:hypothetical protein
LVGFFCCIIFAAKFSARKGFMISYSFSLVSSILLIFARKITVLKELTPALVLIDKAGISVSFGFIYFAPIKFFDSKHYGLVVGCINFFARIIASFAPMIAETGEIIPMVVVSILCLSAVIGTYFLQEK